MREFFIEADRQSFNVIERRVKDLLAKGIYPVSFKMPLFMQFDLTYRCNLKCLHCFNRSGQRHSSLEMTTGEWLKLSKEIIANGGIFDLVLSGGEALLLGDDLIKILDLFSEDSTPVTLITNGYLVNERWAKRLRKYDLLRIRLSIDGCDKILHDSLRGVPGSFDRALNAARLFSKAGIPFHISSCVTPASLDKMNQMVELAANLGAEFLGFELVLLSGRATDNSHLLLSPEQIDMMLKTIIRLRHTGKLPVLYGTGYSMVQYHLSGFPNRVVVIRANGDVRLSCFAPFVIGNVREESLQDIWLNKGVNAWRHPDVVRYLKNANLITAENDYLTNYNAEDIRL